MNPLREAWIRHRTDNPRARTLDIAKALGVSEGALLASRVGDGAVRLRDDWKALVEGFKGVGRVMCLTRNAHVVHERRGAFLEVRADGPVGGVFGPDIDLRLFMSRWGAAFATPVETRTGHLDSIQVFDHNGIAAIKVYREADGDPAAWHALVDALAAPEQTPGWAPRPADPKPSPKADSEIDVPAFRAAWDALQDTHDFFGMLRQHGVAREQALRLAGPERAAPLSTGSLHALLASIAEVGITCMIFVASPGCVQIHSGTLHRVAPTGDWLNVLDPDFNLHVHSPGVASCWLVRKPTSNGFVNSLEAYDSEGELLLQVFGKRTEGTSQKAEWHELLDETGRLFPLHPVAEG